VADACKCGNEPSGSVKCGEFLDKQHCFFFLLWMPDCWLEVSIRKGLRPAISTQVFLGFPVPKSKC